MGAEITDRKVRWESKNPITMGDLANLRMEMAYRPEVREKDKQYTARVETFFNLYKNPTMKVVFDPFLPNRNYSRIVFYHVNDGAASHIGQLALDQDAKWLPNMYSTFNVYDADLADIADPKVGNDKTRQISPSDVMVLPESVTGAIGFDGPVWWMNT